MSFRKTGNRHGIWADLVAENRDLLVDLPREALSSEAAFRDYVTRGRHRGVAFNPMVFELSRDSLDRLWTFINHRAQFDMDAANFEHFNDAFRRRG